MGYIRDLRQLVGSQPLIMVGSGVLAIDSDEQLLMVLRMDNGQWGIPGGALEPGESLEEAAHRELAEETGLSAVDLDLLTVLSGPGCYYQYPNGDEVHNVVALFVASEVSGVARPCGIETAVVQRFPLSELPTELDPIDKLSIEYFVEHRN